MTDDTRVSGSGGWVMMIMVSGLTVNSSEIASGLIIFSLTQKKLQ